MPVQAVPRARGRRRPSARLAQPAAQHAPPFLEAHAREAVLARRQEPARLRHPQEPAQHHLELPVRARQQPCFTRTRRAPRCVYERLQDREAAVREALAEDEALALFGNCSTRSSSHFAKSYHFTSNTGGSLARAMPCAPPEGSPRPAPGNERDPRPRNRARAAVEGADGGDRASRTRAPCRRAGRTARA